MTMVGFARNVRNGQLLCVECTGKDQMRIVDTTKTNESEVRKTLFVKVKREREDIDMNEKFPTYPSKRKKVRTLKYLDEESEEEEIDPEECQTTLKQTQSDLDVLQNKHNNLKTAHSTLTKAYINLSNNLNKQKNN
jgi:hypothetical protein